MQKKPLTAEDEKLVAAAMDAVKQPVNQIDGVLPALVGAALRMDDGEIITSLNLIADVHSISMCAEPQAIAQANRRTKNKTVAIVAVYHQPGHEPRVIPPCGRCREIITDFVDGDVILRDPGSPELYKVRAGDLLPFKYRDYWKGDDLI